ncbi:hypothetical protein G4X40_03260 [Rhodococcus sp. D2-41]|uniref:Mce-associated membrane protein n=1 Tax=Speluncibacter jeojiensis TaxID=2710754 RepID=A0A9X4RF13_9ACTN|nr:hypothetical protein [Rhodococcus sp. D2-41]MDG3009164.1 hypothetical protein [Rhodococcus sp. D2-41]MDG3016163.1 hypothetical protein [Corynebacteriales bacterium D3-21]
MTQQTPDGTDDAGKAGVNADPGSADPAVTPDPAAAETPGVETPVAADVAAGRSRLLKPAIVASAVLALAAVVAAAVYGGIWIYNASAVKSKADDRDQALIDARQAAINLNTVDSAHMDKTIADILSSSTGALEDNFKQSKDQLEKVTEARGVSTSAKVSDAVITSFDHDAGTAEAMAFVVQTQTSKDQQPKIVRIGMHLTMKKVGDTWKASDAKLLFQGVDGGSPTAPAPQPAPAPADGN